MSKLLVIRVVLMHIALFALVVDSKTRSAKTSFDAEINLGHVVSLKNEGTEGSEKFKVAFDEYVNSCIKESEPLKAGLIENCIRYIQERIPPNVRDYYFDSICENISEVGLDDPEKKQKLIQICKRKGVLLSNNSDEMSVLRRAFEESTLNYVDFALDSLDDKFDLNTSRRRCKLLLELDYLDYSLRASFLKLKLVMGEINGPNEKKILKMVNDLAEQCIKENQADTLSNVLTLVKSNYEFRKLRQVGSTDVRDGLKVFLETRSKGSE